MSQGWSGTSRPRATLGRMIQGGRLQGRGPHWGPAGWALGSGRVARGLHVEPETEGEEMSPG